MSKELEAFELPEDYRFVYEIKGCENKIDFDTNTIVEKILSTRTKQVDEEIIKQLKNIGEEKGINELILIDERKVLKMIKSVKALEIIKEKEVNVHNFKEIIIKQDWTYEQYLDEENDPNTSGHQFAYKLLTQEEYDLLKEWLEK